MGDAESNVGTDFSLRSSGKTYLDRKNESKRILDRIMTSSAAVIGIAGVRGAGKSSLAKKVLDQCDSSGFFTLLIPSPTGYEPREFLLAVFQRIAEHATDRIQTLTEGAEDLAALGLHRVNEARRRFLIVLGGVILFLAAGSIAPFVPSVLRDANEREVIAKDLEAQASAVEQEMEKRRNLALPAAREESRTPDELRKQGPARDVIFDAPRVPLHELKRVLPTIDSAALGDVLDSINRRRSYYSRSLDAQVYYSAGLGLVTVLIYLIVIVGGIHAFRLFKRYRMFARHKAEIGLYFRCQEFLEMAKYQSTLSSSKELSTTMKFLAGKLTNSRQLADRPLSLPGLTATCSEFLQNVAEVFSGKVVVCIDELDKITDVGQLFELLKGIKGILGQENTYFMLTVSEDAMAFFSERLSRDRSLVESSFEEIVYLDRLSRSVANEVIVGSLRLQNIDDQLFLKNSAILWIFAAGIPREIKRHLFTCHSRGVSLDTFPSFVLWKLLYLEMLKSMLATSAPKEALNVGEQYKFLISVEAAIAYVDTLQGEPRFSDVVGSLTTILRRHFGPAFRTLLDTAAIKRTTLKPKPPSTTVIDYLPQLVEMLIGALVLGVANNELADDKLDPDKLDALIYVYKYVPINPQYALYGLNQFLETKLQALGVNLEGLGSGSTGKRSRSTPPPAAASAE